MRRITTASQSDSPSGGGRRRKALELMTAAQEKDSTADGQGFRHRATGTHARSRPAFQAAQGIPQAIELLVERVVLLELVFDVLDARLDLLGNRADVGDIRHVTPGSGGNAS